MLAVESSGSYEFNLGTEKGTTVQELVDSFISFNGSFLFDVVSRREGDLGVSLADSSLALEKLNWRAECSLDEMIKDTLSVYFNKNNE